MEVTLKTLLCFSLHFTMLDTRSLCTHGFYYSFEPRTIKIKIKSTEFVL